MSTLLGAMILVTALSFLAAFPKGETYLGWWSAPSFTLALLITVVALLAALDAARQASREWNDALKAMTTTPFSSLPLGSVAEALRRTPTWHSHFPEVFKSSAPEVTEALWKRLRDRNSSLNDGLKEDLQLAVEGSDATFQNLVQRVLEKSRE